MMMMMMYTAPYMAKLMPFTRLYSPWPFRHTERQSVVFLRQND